MTACQHLRPILTLVTVWMALTAMAALGQSTRPEVFGQFGVTRIGEDEGSVGSGPTFGGAVTVPFARRWAVDVAVNTTTAERQIGGSNLESSSTFLLPAVVYRRGTEKAHFFIGGGPGVEFTNRRLEEISRRVFDTNDHGGLLHWRTGFVASVSSRVLVRFDVLLAHRFVLPSIGATGGIGYRF